MARNREIIDVSVKGARKAQSSLKGLGSAALKLGGAFFAAKGLVKGMSTIVESGSKLKSVEMAFNNMGAKIGLSENAFKKLQDATDGTVSKLDLMTKANNAMALGIVESDEQMAEMFDTAQKLGKALGQDTASALDSLVTGMGRQSKLMLDNLGIMVDTQGAYEGYATSIGKTVSQLTDAEKKTAFNNAAMTEATRIANAMGEEQLTTADKISKLKNTFFDMASSIGSSADGMFSSVVDSAQGVASKIAEGLDFAKTIDWKATATNLFQNLGVMYEGMRKIAVLVFEFLMQNIKKIISRLPEAFMMWVDWLKNDLWPFIKNMGKMLWEPWIISVKIAVSWIQLKFQEMWNSIKQFGVDGVNWLIEKWNWITSWFGGEPVELILDVSDENVEATKEKIAGFKEDLIETDLGGAIFGSKEEQVDTFAEFGDALGEIVTDMTDKIIVQNEKVITSDNKVSENKDKLEVKEKNRAKTEFKLTKDIVDSRSKAGKQFVSDLQMMGEKSEEMKKVFKKVAIAETLASTYKAAQDQFAAFSKDYPAPLGMILGIASAAAAIGAGLLRVQEIKKAQYGANFVTSGPQMMMVGEGSGPEHVQVTPLVDENKSGPQGQPLTVNISGNVMTDDFVEDTLVEKIRESLRLGWNLEHGLV